MALLAVVSKDSLPPVITIDGLSGSGKGTISLLLAKQLKWHFLDSGAIYRAIAWAILHYRVSPHDQLALQQLLKNVQISIESHGDGLTATVKCDDHDVSTAIRAEECAQMASKVSVLPVVRQAVLQYQRDFRIAPGLVADGRDMGTVVFPDAMLKFFLVADPVQRALRRYQQLQQQGINVSLRDVQADLAARDQRDGERAISPVKPAPDAIVIDTTDLTINQVLAQTLQYANKCLHN